MESINFNLREPKSSKPTNLYCVVKLNGKQYKFAMGVKIAPYYWDKKKQQPIINIGMSEEEKENALNILRIKNEIIFGFSDFFSYICNNGSATIEEIKKIIGTVINKKDEERENLMNNGNLRNGKGRAPKATTLLERAFNAYYSEIKPTTTESTRKAQHHTLNGFYKYCDEKGKDAQSMLSKSGLNDYKKYLCEKGDSPQNVNNKCEIIVMLINKVLAAHPTFDKYNINAVSYIKMAEVRRNGEEKAHQPLTPQELERIENCEGLTPQEQEYRDIFVLQANVGCRVSDVPKVFESKGNIHVEDGKELLYFKTKKKGTNGVVFLNDIIKSIIERYKVGFKHATPFANANFTRDYNKALRKIAQQANVDRLIQVKDPHGNIENKPLYKIISSHCARYTFVRMMLDKGLTADEITTFTANSREMVERVYSFITEQDAIKKANKAINKVLGMNDKQPTTTSGITEADLIKEAKEAIYCLGGDMNELMDVNNLHELNEILYIDYHDKYAKMGCKMQYIKDLYCKRDISLTEKRKLIRNIIDEVRKKAV